MTKTDKQSAGGALVLLAGCIFLGYQKRHPNVPFTICFPLVMFLLWAWMGRAFSANWLVRHDTDQFVFRKPLLFQACYAALGFGVAAITVPTWLDPVLSTNERCVITLFFVGVAALLLWGAEPSRTTFDLARQEYTWTRGFWPFTRTSHDSTSGGTVQWTEPRNGTCQIRFLPASGSASRFGPGYGNLVAWCTPEQAEAQAYGLADALNLLVERKR